MNVARWLIARFAPEEWRESMAGDLEEERERRVAAGRSAGAGWAVSAALITLGKVILETRQGDSTMAQRPGFRLETWLSECRLAIRSLAAAPGFTAIALIVLTLGIGASTAIFSVVDAVVLRGLPFDQANRLMAVGEMNTARSTVPFPGSTTMPTFVDWKAQQHSFESFAALASASSFVTRDGDRPERLTALRTTAEFFDVLRVQPRIGHAYTAQNQIPGNERVAVISDGFWRRRFGADPDVIGKSIQVDAGVWQIIGVMPPDFSYPVAAVKPTDLWVPYVATEANDKSRNAGRNYYFRVIARLKDGVTLPQAAAEMDGITRSLALTDPVWYKDQVAVVQSLHEATVGRARSWMLMMLGAVGFVLLIACVNVANLMLARATTRAREIGIRAALGASRWQIARGLLIESLVLSIAGSLLALLVAMWGVDVLRASLPTSLPRMAAIGIDLRVLGATAIAAVVTGLLFGLLPALQLSRPNLAGVLGEGGRAGMAGRERQRVRSALVVIEVALAVVLLVGAGLFVSSFVRLINVDLGLDTHNVMAVGVNPRLDSGDPEVWKQATARTPALVADALQRIRAIPGVEVAAALQGGMPLSGGWYRNVITLPGVPPFESDADQVEIRKVSPEYARVIHAVVRRGRYVDQTDTLGAPLVVVLNEESVRRFFGGRDPIGTTVQLDDASRVVVGIVADTRPGGPEQAIRPEAYIPFAQTSGIGATILMRTSVDPMKVAPAVRAAVQTVLPDVPIQDPATMDGSLASMLSQRKFNMLLIGLFGVLAIVIAAVGIYGVMAYIVAQQTKEIGLRMALGALPQSVLRGVLARAIFVMAIGGAFGFAGAWMLAATIRSFLFSVEPHDPVVFVTVAALLTSVGLVAAFVPARRAAHVDPMVALRAD